MKFKTFDLNAYKSRAGITLSFDKKDRALGIITSKLFHLDSKHPLKLKITNNQAERYRIKQEIKQTDYKGCVTEGVMQLADIIEEKIILMDYHNANKENWQDWMRVFAYEYLYDVAFNRGVRHERKRRKAKSKPLTAFDLISANDVIELSNELGISEDKLTYAVLEVISKRKNGGKA
ncbi:hypothetical protein EFK23_00030 [Lactococcus lactis subsp. lactis]|uniref:hypothetical protein n=1 Tax=Lactococcus lactis TaxID=1358 RepID=UPI00223BB074|nr:hypothetical protein [Lactococcus lactis]MCT0033773.1 hypothetical protein [Lactococcus lactis subsp. lactis]